MVKVTIDDSVQDARGNERLIDLLNRIGTKLAQVCYHPQLGPVQTCDTCRVETNGQLVRCLRNRCFGWNDGIDKIGEGLRSATTGIRPNPQ
jgi:predicted molibdopterin-dependent oxidoreductase YjgC